MHTPEVTNVTPAATQIVAASAAFQTAAHVAMTAKAHAAKPTPLANIIKASFITS